MKHFIWLLVLLSATAFAQGSSGSGNGGFAIITSKSEVIPLDVIDQNTGSPIPLLVMDRREQLDERLAHVLKKEPELLGRVRAQLEADRDYDLWEIGKDHLTNDRFFDADLPQSVKLIQVAIRDGKGITRTNTPITLALYKRVLELHEALYQVGIEFYHHTNPILARTLTAAVMSPNSAKKYLKTLIRAYKDPVYLYPKNTFLRKSSYYQAGFVYTHSTTMVLPWNQERKFQQEFARRTCPHAMAVDYDGIGGLHFTFITQWGVHFTRFHPGGKYFSERIPQIRKEDGTLRRFGLDFQSDLFGLRPVLDMDGADVPEAKHGILLCSFTRVPYSNQREALDWIINQDRF